MRRLFVLVNLITEVPQNLRGLALADQYADFPRLLHKFPVG